ncbi:MAG: transposase [Nitrospirae bacterium]|nr:transposase [Nitrospirota bacterium]
MSLCQRRSFPGEIACGRTPILPEDGPFLKIGRWEDRDHVKVPLELLSAPFLGRSPRGGQADFFAFFSTILSYKAESAGREFRKVNPAHTSQTCSSCGHRQKMPLSDRTYSCPCCGMEKDRDLNASLNILRLGLESRG